MERLQKVLANAGVASRRRCEELIAAGEVAVNGVTVTGVGLKVDPERDEIMVGGRRLTAPPPKRYLALYKPRGYVSTLSDEKGRKCLLDLLAGYNHRVYPVGRLDYTSEGLLLLTNDGDLTYALTHPKRRIPKKYLVRVEGRPPKEQLRQLARGVPWEGGYTAPAKVKEAAFAAGRALLEITLYEGRNRQIRKMCAYIGYPVLRLVRTQIANILLGDLRPGQYRFLEGKELEELKQLGGLAHVEE